MIILIVFSIITLCVLSICNHLSNKIIYPKTLSPSESIKIEVEKGRLDEKYFDSLKKEELYIESPYGYKLYALFIPGKDTKKAVILCHGIRHTLYSSAKYIKLFYERGFSILLYDQRNHGKSGGNNTTFGYYEKYDLGSCVNYLKERLGNDSTIGIHGESMGASISLQYLEMDKNIAFLISDCPFSSLYEILVYRMKYDYKLPIFPFIAISSFITWLKCSMTFKSVSPYNSIQNVSTPVLFIHGELDLYVPCKMSKALYKKKQGAKSLYIAPNATHVNSYISNKTSYNNAVNDFLLQLGL